MKNNSTNIGPNKQVTPAMRCAANEWNQQAREHGEWFRREFRKIHSAQSSKNDPKTVQSQ